MRLPVVDSVRMLARVTMAVINVDKCRRSVLYLRFYSRLQLHVKAPGLLASVLHASLPMLKLRRLGSFARPARLRTRAI